MSRIAATTLVVCEVEELTFQITLREFRRSLTTAEAPRKRLTVPTTVAMMPSVGLEVCASMNCAARAPSDPRNCQPRGDPSLRGGRTVDQSDDAHDHDEHWRNREQRVIRERRAQVSGIVGRPFVESVEKERAHLTRLECAKPAHLPRDVECLLRIGLRKIIAGHGDPSRYGDSCRAIDVPELQEIGRVRRVVTEPPCDQVKRRFGCSRQNADKRLSREVTV